MEGHVVFHPDLDSAADMANLLRGRGFQVALAGPVDQTFLRNDGGFPTDVVGDRRWIVLAVDRGSELTLV